jgi:hypothetical protein
MARFYARSEVFVEMVIWRGTSATMPILARVAGISIKPRVQTRGQIPHQLASRREAATENRSIASLTPVLPLFTGCDPNLTIVDAVLTTIILLTALKNKV